MLAALDRMDREKAIAPPTKNEQSRIDSALAAAAASIEKATDGADHSFDLQLDNAAALLQAGKFEDADRKLKEIEQKHPDDPRVKNARGAWLIQKAAHSETLAEAKLLRARAEELLKSATAGEPQAWMNLFELYQVQGKEDESADAARKYAQAAGDPIIRDLIQARLGAAP